MKPTVRRVDGAITRTVPNQVAMQPADFLMPAVERRDEGLLVTSQKSLGADPRVVLTWDVEHQYWAEGFRLLVFRSQSGFAPDSKTKDFSQHGDMILEETSNGCLEERLPEGTHYYTFLLYRSTFWKEYIGGVVRFSETIPSARTAIARIEDQLRLQQLEQNHALGGIKSQIAMNEALIALQRSTAKLKDLAKPDDSLEGQVRRDVEVIVRKKLKKAMTRVELVVALQDVQKQLRRSPSWKKMEPRRREQMLQQIINDFDPDEESMQP